MGFPAKKENKKLTYKDYLKTPEGAKFQLIEGELIMVPSPNIAHQEILLNLGVVLKQFVDASNLGKVFIAPTDVYLDNGNVVQPDILFVSRNKKNIITKQNIKGPPDLVVEIVSSSSTYRDIVQKKNLYAQFKVAEYWLVYPEEKVVEIYWLKDSGFKLYKAFQDKDVLISPLLANFKLNLDKVFGS